VRRGLAAWAAGCVVSGLLIAATAGTGSPARAAAGPVCPRSLSGSTPPADGQSAAARPVILVHGWTGEPLTGTAAALQATLGASISTFTFSYSKWAADWPTNANIAPCLAQYVAQVSSAYASAGGDGRVILAAHSMGGLAIRYASSPQYAANPITAAEAPLVITLDTPYLGSPWGGTPAPEAKELLGAVQGKSVPNPFGTDGGLCLQPHDNGQQLPAQCGGLPPWLPGGTVLDELGGDITIDRTLLGVHLYNINTVSDGIVNTGSSTGYRTSGPGGAAPVVSAATTGTTLHSQYVGCTVTTGQIDNALNAIDGEISSLGLPLEGLSDYAVLQQLQNGQDTPAVMAYSAAALGTAGCSHINVTSDADAIAVVDADIRSYLTAHPGQAPVSLSNFAGRWFVHDGDLCIGQLLPVDGPGSRIFPGTEPCNGSSNWGYVGFWGCGSITGGSSSCTWQYYTVSLTLNSDGSLTVKIAGNPFYVINDVIVPPDPSYVPALPIGYAFSLTKADANLLTETDSNGNQVSWCNNQSTQEQQQRCN
jgi:Putative serine esterase (DUF676)